MERRIVIAAALLVVSSVPTSAAAQGNRIGEYEWGVGYSSVSVKYKWLDNTGTAHTEPRALYGQTGEGVTSPDFFFDTSFPVFDVGVSLNLVFGLRWATGGDAGNIYLGGAVAKRLKHGGYVSLRGIAYDVPSDQEIDHTLFGGAYSGFAGTVRKGKWRADAYRTIKQYGVTGSAGKSITSLSARYRFLGARIDRWESKAKNDSPPPYAVDDNTTFTRLRVYVALGQYDR